MPPPNADSTVQSEVTRTSALALAREGLIELGSDEDFVFEDMFDRDPASDRRLDDIASLVRPLEGGRLFDFTPEADEEQQRFIDSEAATIRLLAPAGSGKTQSVANRVIRRASKGESLSRFLILTFDNAAASSLREKLQSGLASLHAARPGNPQVLTLNKFGYGLFRGILNDRYGRLTLGENPESDRHEAMRRALDDLKSAQPEVHALLPRELARRVYLDLVSALKTNLVQPDDLFSKEANTGRQRFLDMCEANRLLDPWLEVLRGRLFEEAERRLVVNGLANLYRQYCRLMRNHNRIDFDDQKLLPYLAFAADERLARAATSQFCCVIVDEFQDINRLDFELIRLIARDKQLIVVGDDDQAIYAFRSCSPDYILRFPEHIGRQVETHVLRVNYRSPRNVVKMSNQLIRGNTCRIEKDQRAYSDRDVDVKVWHCLNSGSEAQVFARTIKRLHADLAAGGFRYSDVAILFRMNSQSLPLQMALILEEIPYHCRKEDNVIVSDTMEKLLGLIGLHLRLQGDPSHRCLADTRLLCNCYFRCPRDQDVQQLQRSAEQTGRYDLAARAAARESGPGGKFTQNFVRAVDALFVEATPARLVQAIASKFKNLGGLVGTLEDAINNALPLGELVDIASRFKGDTRQFHEMISGLLARVQGGLFHEEEGDAVNLLTYFRAKGRQWHTVMIPGVNQKVIPHVRARVEDERRLFYVAVTRATHNLTLSYVRQAVRSPVEPSQFLAEMGVGKAEEKRAGAIS
jgi:DNA helicase-2/ATP-dependent DNA helicase PcrA